MGNFYFEKGLVISRYDQFLEFSSRYNQELYFENPENGQKITIPESQFWGEFQTKRLKVCDAFSSPKYMELPGESASESLKTLADLPEKCQEIAIRKISYVKRLKERGISKGQLKDIDDAAREIAEEIEDPKPPSSKTINRWWKQMDKHHGSVYVLGVGHSYRNRGKNLGEESERFLQDFIDDNYAINTRPSAASAHRKYEVVAEAENKRRIEFGKPALAITSERTLRRRISDRPKEEMMTARVGRQATRAHYRMIKGHLHADHPLDVAEIDHTPMNLIVIDDRGNIPLGRPWLTAIKDRRTGVLLGFYVSFQQTGLNAIFGALKHSLSSHHLAYEMWPELENPWPFGRAHHYFSDRGADFMSLQYRSAITSLGSFYEYAERRSPWLKASVERFFLTLEQTFFECTPGRTFPSYDLLGDYNPHKEAVIRFSTLVFLLHKWAVDYHNVFVNERKQASPIDLWNEGIEIAPPSYHASTDELNVMLGKHQSGVLSQEGIRLNWMTYANDQLRELMGDLGKGYRVNYTVNSEDLGEIYALDPRTNTRFCVPNTRPDYACGLSEYQHKMLRQWAAEKLTKSTAIDTLMRTREMIAERIGEELEAKKNNTKARHARLAGINSNAVLEGESKSILNPFEGQTIEVPSREIIVPSGPSFTNVPTYQWGA